MKATNDSADKKMRVMDSFWKKETTTTEWNIFFRKLFRRKITSQRHLQLKFV